jgi:hypothetical protein
MGPCVPCDPAKAYVVVTLTQCGAIPVLTVITNNHNGSLTIKGNGTAGAQYYVVTSGNIKAHMSGWTPVAGSTNTAGGDGKWSCVVNDPAPAYYRATAVHPAP